MDKLNERDISLLFKDLVVLPSDLSHTIIDAPTSKKSPVNEEKPSLSATKKVLPFNCIVHDDIAASLAQPDSSFNRILESLNISNTTRYYRKYGSLDDISDVNQFTTLLTIGLSEEAQTKINQQRTGPTHHAKNPEVLETKEEKRAMYNPFKQFVSDNLETFSQL